MSKNTTRLVARDKRFELAGVTPHLMAALKGLNSRVTRSIRSIYTLQNSLAYFNLAEEEHMAQRCADILAALRLRLQLRDGPQFVRALAEAAKRLPDPDQLNLPLPEDEGSDE